MFDNLFLLVGPVGTSAMLFVTLFVVTGACSIAALGQGAQRSS